MQPNYTNYSNKLKKDKMRVKKNRGGKKIGILRVSRFPKGSELKRIKKYLDKHFCTGDEFRFIQNNKVIIVNYADLKQQ